MSFSRAYLIIGLIATCFTSSLVNGHPDGAPVSSCDTLTIGHDNEGGAQPDPTLYMIMLDAPKVAPGGTVSVWVMSDSSASYFEGILLKAIDDSQEETDYSGTAGTFTISDADTALYHYLSCSDVAQSAVTHSSPVNKTDVTFTWNAPTTAGSYSFVASIAQNHDVYWLPIRSAPVEVTAA